MNSLNTAFAGECGVAREDITPPVGIYARSWGAAAHDAAEGIHRPLTLTALAISAAGEEPLLLIEADLGWWKHAKDEWFIRSGVLDALKLDPTRVIFTLSQTHAGPSLCPDDDGAKPGGHLIRPYLDRVRERAIRAGRAALDGRRRARLGWRYGRCDLARDRDRHDAAGGRYVVGCSGVKTDDTLLVGRLEEANGGPLLATIVNYACHPTTLAWENRLISPDYVGAMRATIEAATHAPCLFLNGALGNLAPAEQYVGDVEVADRHGRRLAYSALTVLESWADETLDFGRIVESGAPLGLMKVIPATLDTAADASRIDVPLTLKPMPSIAEIERALAANPGRLETERLRRQRASRQSVGEGPTMAIPIWIWRLGGAVIVGLPAEPYSVFQTELRERFAGHPIAILNLTNGSAFGYLPPRAFYEGSEYRYTIWQTPFAAGSLEMTIEAAAGRIAEMFRTSTAAASTSRVTE